MRLPRVAQVGTTCVRSTGNSLCASIPVTAPLHTRSSSGIFLCLRHTASANLCHPTRNTSGPMDRSNVRDGITSSRCMPQLGRRSLQTNAPPHSHPNTRPCRRCAASHKTWCPFSPEQLGRQLVQLGSNLAANLARATLPSCSRQTASAKLCHPRARPATLITSRR